MIVHQQPDVSSKRCGKKSGHVAGPKWPQLLTSTTSWLEKFSLASIGSKKIQRWQVWVVSPSWICFTWTILNRVNPIRSALNHHKITMEKIISLKPTASHHAPSCPMGIPGDTKFNGVTSRWCLATEGWPDSLDDSVALAEGSCELRVNSVGLMGLLKYVWPQILDLQVFFLFESIPSSSKLGSPSSQGVSFCKKSLGI